jgi:hypothetical protein
MEKKKMQGCLVAEIIIKKNPDCKVSSSFSHHPSLQEQPKNQST